jgi:histone deacetylase 1/2
MFTTPNICHVVGLVNIYQSNSGQSYWKAIKKVLRYLNGINDYSLCYQGNDLQLKGYIDTNWRGDKDEIKYTFGFVFLLNNDVIS